MPLVCLALCPMLNLVLHWLVWDGHNNQYAFVRREHVTRESRRVEESSPFSVARVLNTQGLRS